MKGAPRPCAKKARFYVIVNTNFARLLRVSPKPLCFLGPAMLDCDKRVATTRPALGSWYYRGPSAFPTLLALSVLGARRPNGFPYRI